MASSADGSKLLATVAGGGIFSSSNSGTTWISNGIPWQIADGDIILSNNAIWQTQGTIWTSNNAARQSWSAVFSSPDGNTLLALAQFGWAAKSTNGGAAWNLLSTPYEFWKSIASSADGNKLIAATSGGYVYQSVDGGAAWNPANVVLGTNATSVDTVSFGIQVTNANTHVATNYVYSSTTFTNSIALDSDMVGATNFFGISLSGGTITGTNVANVLALLSINLGGTDELDLSPVSTNTLGTNLLGSGLVVPASTTTNVTIANMAVPNPAGQVISNQLVASTKAMAVLTNSVPGMRILLTNTLNLQVAIANIPQTWSAVASSADGSHLAAAVNGGLIYTSSDGGVTWQPSGAPATGLDVPRHVRLMATSCWRQPLETM